MKKSSYKSYIVSESQIECPSLELYQVKLKHAILERLSVLLEKNDISDWDQSNPSRSSTG